MAPSQDVVDGLGRIAAEASTQSTNRTAAPYENLFQSITTPVDASSSSSSVLTQVGEDLAAVIEFAMQQSLGVVTTRHVIGLLITSLSTLNAPVVTIVTGARALAALAPQQSSFLDQAAAIRELMADAHESCNDFTAAARVLIDIPLDSQQRKVTNTDRARIWVRIARDFLEEDDAISAQPYVNKLMAVMGPHDVTDPELTLHFKLCQARVQDAKREFLTASARYYEISLLPVVSEDERLHTLSMAIKCAVLAPAGPQRNRMLAKLRRDDRSAALDEYPILEKLLLGRLLDADEVGRLASTMQPHQLAITSDGSTVLQRAVVEHNVLALSRLYTNISFDSLADRLGLDNEDQAEETVARMIEQGRLAGNMDQLDRYVFFEGGEASGVKGSGRAEVPVGKEIRQWDANIQGLSEEVELITNALQLEFPEFVQAKLQA